MLRLLLLLPFAAASRIAYRDITPSGNLVLADCGIGKLPNGGSTSRQMIYYSGDIWVSPGSWTTNSPQGIVEVPWDGSYPWRSTGVTANMPNVGTWTVNIDPSVKDPDYAGWTTGSLSSVGCYSFHGYGIYTLADGTVCDTAYVCNDRTSAPTPPGSSTTTTTTSSASPTSTVSFAHHNQGPGVQLIGEWTLDQLFASATLSDGGAPGTQYCPGLDSPATLKGSGKYSEPDCTIAVKCGPLNAPLMLSVAKQMLAARSMAYNTTTQDLIACQELATCVPDYCYYTCDQKPDCFCSGKMSSERKVTNLASGDVQIDMIGGDGAAQSTLAYKISCPKAEDIVDCRACKGLAIGSVFLNLITFGIAGAIGNFICDLDHC